MTIPLVACYNFLVNWRSNTQIFTSYEEHDKEMPKSKNIGFAFLQVLVGCLSGVLAGGILLYLINLAWQGVKNLNLGGFLTAVLLLISFLIVYGAVVMATAEGVRQMGRFIPKRTSRRRTYEGSFLGACAAVAVLTVTRGDWASTLNEWGGPVKLIGTLFYYLIIPLKVVMYLFPPILVLLIAAPIGAAIGFNLPPPEGKKPEAEETQENSKTGNEK